MENNKTTNRNGSDVGRYSGSASGQARDQAGSSSPSNEPGRNAAGNAGTNESFNDDAKADRPFRRLSRNDSSSSDRERDRNRSGREYSGSFSDRGFGGGGYGYGSRDRDQQRDSFAEQRMDDEGGAQDNRRWRDDARDSQWRSSQGDRYRFDDRQGYGRSQDRGFDSGGRGDSNQSRDFYRNYRNEDRYQQQRFDTNQREDRDDRSGRERASSHRSWWQNEAATVSDVMTRDIKTVGPEATIREVAEIMRKEDVGVVPIVRDDGRLNGLVTDRDLVMRVIAGGKTLDEVRAKDVATTDIEVASPQDALSDVIHLMGRQQIRRVPVVDDNDRLVGIVSLGDIANRADQDEELQAALEKISGRRSFWSRIWR